MKVDAASARKCTATKKFYEEQFHVTAPAASSEGRFAPTCLRFMNVQCTHCAAGGRERVNKESPNQGKSKH